MSPRAKKRGLYLSVILMFLAGVTFIVLGAFKENIVYFKTPSELLAPHNTLPKQIRLGGLVVKGSLQPQSHNTWKFQAEDTTSKITVIFQGYLPDLFREGQGVIAIGTFDPSLKIFHAKQLLAKHDQYYRPPSAPSL